MFVAHVSVVSLVSGTGATVRQTRPTGLRQRVPTAPAKWKLPQQTLTLSRSVQGGRGGGVAKRRGVCIRIEFYESGDVPASLVGVV